jgi:hypothetical protein
LTESPETSDALHFPSHKLREILHPPPKSNHRSIREKTGVVTMLKTSRQTVRQPSAETTQDHPQNKNNLVVINSGVYNIPANSFYLTFFKIIIITYH